MKVVVMTEDNSIRKVEDSEAQALVDAGRATLMTRDQFREFESQNYTPYKKLYGMVKTEIFTEFCHRAYEEGICDENNRTDIGKAVELLVEKYVNDPSIVLVSKKKKDKKASQGADYLGDHAAAEQAPTT